MLLLRGKPTATYFKFPIADLPYNNSKGIAGNLVAKLDEFWSEKTPIYLNLFYFTNIFISPDAANSGKR